MFNNYLDKVLIIVLVCFIFVALIMPYVIKLGLHLGAHKEPGERDIHKGIITRIGGVGIFAGFLLGYMLFGEPSIQMNSILIGSIITFLMGFFDDLKPISALARLAGQVVAALIVVFYGNIIIENITAFGFSVDFGIMSYPITVFFIVACINIINFIDGLDGLSSGICSIFFLTIGIIAFCQGQIDTLPIILTFVMLGSTLGYLLHNFHPAKVMLGDAGAYFLGFIISIISILGYKGTMLTSLIVPILILAVPILDTLFAIIRRILLKKSIATADKDHFHHQFLKITNSQIKTVLIIYGIASLFSIASIFYALGDPEKGMVIYMILLVFVLLFVLHTGIISEKMSTKVKELEKKGLKKIKRKQKQS